MTRFAPVALLLAVLLAACSSADGTSTATPAGPTSTVEATSTARPVRTPIVTPTPNPAATPSVVVGPAVGVWIVDAQTGTHVAIFEGETIPPTVDAPFPAFTSGGAVWVPTWDGVSTRYRADGAVLDTVDGIAVAEAGDGSVRMRFLVDGVTLVLDDSVEEVTVSEDAFRAVVSPDGAAVAYLERRAPDEFDLLVHRVVDGRSAVVARDVQLCQCDDFQRASWSPSGRYFAYADFGRLGSDDPADRGSYVFDAVVGGAPVRVADEPRAYVGWLGTSPSTLLLNRQATAYLVDPAAPSDRLLSPDAPELRGAAQLTADGRTVQIWTPEGDTILIDPETGIELARWSVRGRAILGPFGPAILVDGPARNPVPVPTCNGVWIDHPSLPEAECVRGAARAAWSPDGSLMALQGRPGGGDTWLEIWSFGDDPNRVLIPPRADVIEWSVDGRYLLVAWGFGV